jgi:hypothetical protein
VANGETGLAVDLVDTFLKKNAHDTHYSRPSIENDAYIADPEVASGSKAAVVML